MSLSGPLLLKAIKHLTYVLFFGLTVFSTIFVVVVVKETKGKNKQEIMKLFESDVEELEENLENMV